jgi:hypothetical protein
MLPQRRQPPPILAATAQSTLKFPAPAGGLRAAPRRSEPSGRGKARSPKVARADSSGALRLSQPLPPSPRRARTKCEIRLTPGVAPDSLNPLRRHNILGCARQAGPKHWGWRRQAATADTRLETRRRGWADGRKTQGRERPAGHHDVDTRRRACCCRRLPVHALQYLWFRPGTHGPGSCKPRRARLRTRRQTTTTTRQQPRAKDEEKGRDEYSAPRGGEQRHGRED